MTSVSAAGIALLQSTMSRGRRAGPHPAQRWRDYVGYQLDRPQD
jgi:hypothetical protein